MLNFRGFGFFWQGNNVLKILLKNVDVMGL